MKGALPYPQVVEYGRQIAHGLAAAHGKTIVHRDLKPENLFVTKDGVLKILDFRLARQTRAPEAGLETRLHDDTDPGTVMGTAGYMSPEQARGLVVDHHGDIFAFGAILFEMLNGRRAFQGGTTADTGPLKGLFPPTSCSPCTPHCIALRRYALELRALTAIVDNRSTAKSEQQEGAGEPKGVSGDGRL